MRHPSLIPLSHDHHHGLALALRCRKQALGQLKPLGTAGLRARADEFRKFFSTHLVPHFRAEEEVLFPLLKSVSAESGALVERLLKEHAQIKAVIPQLESNIGLGKLLFDAGDLLERHIRSEERELFPLFEHPVGAQEAEAAGEKIKKILGAR
jgi:hemerythrin-like domain-containing protein